MVYRLARSWGFGPGVLYFSFFGAVEAPESDFDVFTLRRLLHRRRTLWEGEDGSGIVARAVRGPLPRTAVLSVRSIGGGWEEIGVVFWPPRFVALGGHAGGLRYGLGREV